MKRLFSILIAIMVLVSVAYAEDYSSMTEDELYAIQDHVRNELNKRKVEAEGNILIFDHEGVSVYLTGEYSYDYRDALNLNAIIINDSDKEFSFYTEISVNGWDVYSNSAGIEAHPHKKNKDKINIRISQAEISTYEEIEEMDFRISFWFNDDVGQVYNAEPFTLHFPLKE